MKSKVSAAEALQLIRVVQNGDWVRPYDDAPKGTMAAKVWYDTTFAYGMEHGVIAGVMQLFGITKEDLLKVGKDACSGNDNSRL